uniref:Uncharacterized protein n=1 Tax=Meloidogyne hapla TaxID=6305 RepID=A0A1I8BF41_MELHA
MFKLASTNYFSSISQQNKEIENNKKEKLKQLEDFLDCIEDLSLMKRYSFIGAVLLSDNQSVKFFDYLKINKVQLNSNHIDYICRIAISSKNVWFFC